MSAGAEPEYRSGGEEGDAASGELSIPEVGPVEQVEFDEVAEPTIRPPHWDAPASIVVRGVSKWYDSRNRGRLRAALPGRPSKEPPPGAVLALDDASFEIGDGQSVGIIGNNGAGKSTALKLIAGVTAPSQGEIRVAGRVASMIELGLGFNPEMTGRENLRFSAGLLGMSRRVLAKRWEDIVDFSGVAHALENPTKTYSSGMLARLGFALASHSDAEIILVDEVLSVGDFDFQRRSLERIMKLNREGRTTIIVTHNLSALPPLCHRIIQLEKGRVVADGVPGDVIPEYVLAEAEKYAAHGNEEVHISDVELRPTSVHPGGRLTVRGVIETTEPLVGCKAVVRLGMGQALVAVMEGDDSLTRLVDEPLDIRIDRQAGRWQVEATVESLPLFAGDYVAGLAVVRDDTTEVISRTMPLDILGSRDDWMKIRVRLEENHQRLDP
ncbi:MAG: ABC transporter ATP-binding protein [Acidimicrobiia bacterium]|nr:ABC transporter ATP-binding protein [Acidimicrobiia bacterium]